MKLLLLVIILCIAWIGYEMYRAPFMDDDGNIIDKK